MATDINTIKDKIITNNKNQRTPTTYTDDEYLDFAVSGCKRLYIDTGIEDSWSSEFSTDSLSRSLNIVEFDYCVTAGEIEFINSVQSYWSTMISYTTNALSIAYAYKPFEFFETKLKRLENKLVDLFQKMTDVSNASLITDIEVDPVDYTFEVG